MRSKGGLLAVLALTLVSVACTEKGQPYYRHEGAKNTDSSPENPLTPPKSQELSTRTSQWESRFQSSRAGQRLTEALMPIAKEVLAPERVRDPRSLIDQAIADELQVLNRLVLQLTTEEKNSPEFQKLAERYGRVLLLECGEFKDSCTGFRYFKRAANTGAVLKEFLKGGVPMNRVRVILTALELKARGVWDRELIEILASLPAKELTDAERADLASAGAFLDTAILQANNRIESAEDARQFLDSAQAWRLVSASTPIKLSESTNYALFTLMGKAGYLKAGGRSNPDLKHWMEQVRALPGSVGSRQQILEKQKLFAPAAVGAQALQNYDELTFLIDTVSTGVLTSDAAATLIRSLGFANTQISQSVENYVRLMFLAAIFESSVKAREIFTAPKAAEQLLHFAMNESAQIRAIWGAYSSQMQNLRALAINASTNLSEEERRSINGLFDSIPRSIKQASVYPHIMVLFYFLSQKRFELYIPLLGRSIDTARLSQLLWEGKLPPLLPYSDDRTPLSYYELLHAFDMAVRTNLFESVKIETDDFIADNLRRLSENPLAVMDDTLNGIELRRQDAVFFRDFKESCKELVGGQPYPRTMYFGRLFSSPYFGRLKELAETKFRSFNTDTEAPVGADKTVSGLFYLDSTFNDVLESARLDLGTLERMGELMVKSYSDYLTEYRGASAAEVQRKTRKARAAIQFLSQKRRRVLAQAQDFYKEFGYCYNKLALMEARKDEILIEYEQEYFRRIHRQIQRLRTPGLSPEEKAQIENSIRFSGLPSDFKGLDRILESGYKYSTIDTYIRMAQYQMYGLKYLDLNLPAVSPNLTYTFGEKLNLDVKIVREAKEIFVPFSESEEEFVASAMRGMVENVFLSRSNSFSEVIDIFKNLASMYRMEYEFSGHARFMTPEVILRDFDDIFERSQFSPRRRKQMNYLRQTAWSTSTPLLGFNFLFVRVNYDDRARDFGEATGYWGLYDFLLTMMANEQLGYYLSAQQAGIPTSILPQRETAFTGGRLYHKSRFYRGNPVLPVNPKIDQFLDEKLGGFVRTEIRAIEDFRSAVMKRIETSSKLPAAQRPRVDLTTTFSLTEWYTESALTDYPNKLKTFHQNTGSFFLNP